MWAKTVDRAAEVVVGASDKIPPLCVRLDGGVDYC